MIEFFSHFSTYAVAAMMVSLFVALSLISLWIVRRFCKPLLFTEHTEFGEIFSSAIGVVFALILAFVAVAVWQNYDKVDDNVFREANSLHNIYRNLEVYPEPVKTEAKNLIRQYVQVVIKDEWPKLAQSRQDDNAHQLLNRIKSLILTFNPRTNGELVLHQETVRQLSEYSGLRHNRIIGGRHNLRPPIWLTLIGGTVLYLLFLCFLDIPDERHHAVMIGSLAAFLGLVFFLLVTYNYPFTKPGGIPSDSFKELPEYWKLDVKPAPPAK
jgi:hypothetical protein